MYGDHITLQHIITRSFFFYICWWSFQWTWVFLLHLKFDVSIIMKQIFVMVRTQFGVQVKLFRSDNGGEFFNFQCNELSKNHGIVHQCSCSHTPQQNGLVERKHRHILESARAIIFQDHLPIRFWGHYVETIVHIRNLPMKCCMGRHLYWIIWE